MELTNKSPLRYPGGKTRACKILDNIITTYYNQLSSDTILISPFFGGGSFEFYLQNKYNLSIIANDKFQPLANFWNVCKTESHNLWSKLLEIHKNTVTKPIFQEYRKNIIDEKDKLLQACYYFVINRCSFSGATLSGGFSKEASEKRFTPSSINTIKSNNLTKFEIYNEDFTYFFKNTNVIIQSITNTLDNIFIFVDPPYYLEKRSKLYGDKGDLHESFDHLELFNILNKTKQNWLITYNNCYYIRDLYTDYTILDVNWSYGMNKSKKSSEIVIVNSMK